LANRAGHLDRGYRRSATIRGRRGKPALEVWMRNDG